MPCAGQRLPYEIVAPLGAGGMMAVHRARGSRLSRDVALNVLPGGKGFAVFMAPEGTEKRKSPTRVTFLLNFFDELRRKAPVR